VGRGLRRVELSLPADDLDARQAVLQADFRLEGVRRQVLELPDDSYADLCLFARPASDQVGGRHGFSSVTNLALRKKRLIAHVLIRDEQDRASLCETQFKKDWELPGGIVEALEPPPADQSLLNSRRMYCSVTVSPLFAQVTPASASEASTSANCDIGSDFLSLTKVSVAVPLLSETVKVALSPCT
jgi:hypothetical protein